MRPGRCAERWPVGQAIFLVVVASSIATTCNAWGQTGAATFLPLPFPDASADTPGAYAMDVTNAGVVVGFGGVGPYTRRAIKWDESGSVSQLANDSNYPTTSANSVSEDGQFAVGIASSPPQYRAVVWAPVLGMQVLPDFVSDPDGVGELSEAQVISDDSSTAWGVSTVAPHSAKRIVRWKRDGASVAVKDIGTFSEEHTFHYLVGASADGRIAVGSASDDEAEATAIRIVGTEITALPRFPGKGSGRAYGTDSTGTIVVGAQVGRSAAPFVWRASSGLAALPELDPDGGLSSAYGVADRGVVIVGSQGHDDHQNAVLWIAERPVSLRDYLEDEYGLNLSIWSRIYTAYSISRDGRHLVGFGKTQGESRPFRVTFVGNRPPMANAGADVRKSNAAASGVNVRLDGRKSGDPDPGALDYRWSGIRFNSPTAVRPTARFPVGTTTVKLRVTDAENATSTDTVRVIVKAKRSSIRPEGLAANDAFADAATLTATASVSAETNEAALIAAENAAAADAIGAALGDAFVWGEDESPEAAAADYAAHRLLQSAYGQEAATSLAQAYLETGDAAYAEAYRSARLGTQRALADLADRYEQD